MSEAKNGTALVVMGVSGSGKTTVGELLAKRLGWAFMEGDRLHPPAKVEKMRQGITLTDAVLWPWLERNCDWFGSADRGAGRLTPSRIHAGLAAAQPVRHAGGADSRRARSRDRRRGRD